MTVYVWQDNEVRVIELKRTFCTDDAVHYGVVHCPMFDDACNSLTAYGYFYDNDGSKVRSIRRQCMDTHWKNESFDWLPAGLKTHLFLLGINK